MSELDHPCCRDDQPRVPAQRRATRKGRLPRCRHRGVNSRGFGTALVDRPTIPASWLWWGSERGERTDLAQPCTITSAAPPRPDGTGRDPRRKAMTAPARSSRRRGGFTVEAIDLLDDRDHPLVGGRARTTPAASTVSRSRERERRQRPVSRPLAASKAPAARSTASGPLRWSCPGPARRSVAVHDKIHCGGAQRLARRQGRFRMGDGSMRRIDDVQRLGVDDALDVE